MCTKSPEDIASCPWWCLQSAVGGGWMAAPQLWGGVNYFQHFLAPVLTTASETAAAAATGLLAGRLGNRSGSPRRRR